MLTYYRKKQFKRVLTWLLAATLVVSTIGIFYVAANPSETTDPYTEFYILGPDGNASGYPTELATNETGLLIVGISNHEHERVTYRAVVAWNGTPTQERQVTVSDEGTREIWMNITAPHDTGRHRVQLLLYNETRPEAEPYRSLRLWVRVKTNSSTVTVAASGNQ